MPQSKSLMIARDQTTYQSEISQECENTTRVTEKHPTIPAPNHTTPIHSVSGELPAHSRHVRPDELTAAISAIEARKDETVVRTQPLGTLLSQAKATIAAEEVWTEIAKQRNRITKARTARFRLVRKPRRMGVRIAIGIACIIATLVALYILTGDFYRVL